MCSNKKHFLNSYLSKGKSCVKAEVSRCLQAMSIVVFVSIAVERFISKLEEIKEAQRGSIRVRKEDIKIILYRIKFLFGARKTASEREGYFFDGMRLDIFSKGLIGFVLPKSKLTFRKVEDEKIKSKSDVEVKRLKEKLRIMEDRVSGLTVSLEALYTSYIRKAKIEGEDFVVKSYGNLRNQMVEDGVARFARIPVFTTGNRSRNYSGKKKHVGKLKDPPVASLAVNPKTASGGSKNKGGNEKQDTAFAVASEKTLPEVPKASVATTSKADQKVEVENASPIELSFADVPETQFQDSVSQLDAVVVKSFLAKSEFEQDRAKKRGSNDNGDSDSADGSEKPIPPQKGKTVDLFATSESENDKKTNPKKRLMKHQPKGKKKKAKHVDDDDSNEEQSNVFPFIDDEAIEVEDQDDKSENEETSD